MVNAPSGRSRNRPPVFVVTGPSGAGKGTLIAAVLERVPEVEETVSATTRERRSGEVDGRDYWFLTDEEFARRVEAGEFLEWVWYVGNRYGTLRSEIDRIVAAGRAPVLELETEGALRVRDEVPGSIAIFIAAPLAELERRLRERATESSGEIDDRIAIARKQLQQADEFDHVVVNDRLERAVDELTALIQRELETAGTMSRP